MERSQIQGVAILDTRTTGFESEFSALLHSRDIRTVCVDYFDTIVSRAIAPEDVKRVAAERMARMMRMTDGGQAIYAARSTLEVAICQRNEAENGDPEYSLPDLLESLWHAMPELQKMPQAQFVARGIDLEVSAEAGVQVVDEVLVKALRAVKADGRRLVLISDFYIPRKYFVRMLQLHGLGDLFDAVYISSDYFKTKRTGALYKIVLDELSLSPKDVVMIGDNPYSDIERALSNGLLPVQLDREHRITQYAKLAREGKNHSGVESAIRALFGNEGVFEELALTLYLFIDRLFHDLSRRHVNDVFFMAREGQFLLKLFETYQNARHLSPGHGGIRSHYIKVSRRATFLPSLKPLSEERFEVLFRQYRRISLKDFLESLGLWEKVKGANLRLSHDPSITQEDLPTSEAFAELLRNDRFQQMYEDARLNSLTGFKNYFDSFATDLSSGEVHFVDVGWKGSIQDNLRSIFDCLGGSYAKQKVVGHYLGLVALGSADDRNEKLATIFNTTSTPTRNHLVFNENRALFEIALGANHGSAKAYLYDSLTGHKLLESAFEEVGLHQRKIVPLQSALLRKFETLDSLLRHSYLPHERLFSLASRSHARMVWRPTQDEIRWFEDAYHVENFGVFESSTFIGKSGSRSLLAPIRFYLALRRNPAGLDLGFWPWLRIYQQGGSLIASRYARSRFKLIED